MRRQKAQSYLDEFRENQNIKIISIKTQTSNFDKRFSCISSFWRALKNGLHSFGNRTNREVYKGLSGVYFSLETGEEMQMIIIYDAGTKTLHELDTNIRLRKLLGIGIEVKFGTYPEYESVIMNMFGIRRKIQPFGDYYFSKKVR